MEQPKLEHNARNRLMLLKLHNIVASLLDEMLVPGFFGAGTVRFIVQDGTIQAIEESAERKHREKASMQSAGLHGVDRANLQQRDNRYPKSLPSHAASIMRSSLDDTLEDIKAIGGSIEEKDC